ncbi:MAG: nucleotidyltransferase domain-containing protein [bacterium]|nr:nucleotidyltransferase domain-containing protein [bacterium]
MIYNLFSTKKREKVMAFILNNPSKPHRVRDVAKTLSISPGSISGFFAFLKKNKILKRSGNEFYVNIANPLTRTAKLMINVMSLDVGPLRKIPGFEGIGVYGSCANGTNKEGSDIDIWVKSKKKVGVEAVASASRKMKERAKREVQLLIIDPEKYSQLKDEDPIFFYSLIYGSVVLYGKSLQD